MLYKHSPSDQVNSQNVRHSTHQQAVQWLVSQKGNIELLVEHVPQPAGLQVKCNVYMYMYMYIHSVWLTWPHSHLLIHEATFLSLSATFLKSLTKNIYTYTYSTCMYVCTVHVHCENGSPIHCLALMHSAIILHPHIMWV